MVTNMKTRNRIKEVRESQGISQTELGRLVGLSEPSINRYERGNRKPTRKKLDDIAKALGVPLKALFIDLSPGQFEEGESNGKLR
jgi:transcriptional regulator with XRE-family HTH domain